MATRHADKPHGFTPEQIEQALAHLRAFEASHLSDPVHGFNNPFRRGGVTAKDLAYACGLFKPTEHPDDGLRGDSVAGRRLAKLLVKQGLAESVGHQRTLSAGSQSVECFALAGFSVRLGEAQAAWLKRNMSR